MLRDAMSWLDRINEDVMPARLDLFLAQFGDAEAQLTALSMTKSLDGTADKAKTKAFGEELAFVFDLNHCPPHQFLLDDSRQIELNLEGAALERHSILALCEHGLVCPR